MKRTAWVMIFLCCLIVSAPRENMAEPVKIAAVYAKTGEAAEDNAPSLEGVKIAVNEINRQGGIGGNLLELMAFDNQSTPIGSKIAADKAVKAGVTAIIGASWSSHSLVIAGIAQANKIPMITNSSTHPDVTLTGNYIFRVCYTDLFQAKVIARFVRNELKAETGAVLKNVSSDYSMGLAKEFHKQFEASGGKNLLELSYIQSEKNFDKLLLQIKAVVPDILFIPGYNESGLIAKTAQDMGIKAIFAGGDGWGSRAFYEDGGQDIKQGYYCTHWSENANDASREFVRKYQSSGKNEDYTSIALAYDAVTLLADAMHRAGSYDREKIRDALAQTRNFKGLTGDISFDENRNPLKDVVIMQIKDGKAGYLKTITP